LPHLYSPSRFIDFPFLLASSSLRTRTKWEPTSIALQELLPEKRMLLHGFLHRVSGSEFLEEQVRQLMPDVHVFGHTHLNIDVTRDGVRYIQWPLGTPREQTGQTRVSSFGMMCVYDGSDGGEAPQHWTHWSRHYELYERDLTKTAFAPYVLQFKAGSTPAPPKPPASSLLPEPGGAPKLSWGQEQRLQQGRQHGPPMLL